MDDSEYFRGVLDNLTGGFVGVDLEGKLVYVNPTACRILRLADAAASLGRPHETALAAYPALCAVIGEAVRTHQTVHRAEISVLHADTPMVIGYSTLQVKSPAGAFLGIGIIFQDLSVTRKK